MKKELKKDAFLSDDRKYRYRLTRIWDEEKGLVLFVGLNPSTADETEDDPTIRRCIGFAKSWGYGGIVMVNLFAFRATDPTEMKKEKEPIGNINDNILTEFSIATKLTIIAWGNHGSYMNRDKEVVELLLNPKCLGVTKAGQPKHPLYLPKGTKPVPFLGCKPDPVKEYPKQRHINCQDSRCNTCFADAMKLAEFFTENTKVSKEDHLCQYRKFLEKKDIKCETEHGWFTEEIFNKQNIKSYISYYRRRK